MCKCKKKAEILLGMWVAGRKAVNDSFERLGNCNVWEDDHLDDEKAYCVHYGSVNRFL